MMPIEVYAEMTPNPATMKFVADRMLIENGQQVEYLSQDQSKESSPLATELFNFPFVTGVFISANFVTLTKDDSLGWEMIVMQLREYIKEWLSENELAVTHVPENLTVKHASEPSQVGKSDSPDYNSFDTTEYDKEIRELLDEFVRPAVEQDGGAIDFKAFHEGKVYVQLRGACSGCPSSMMTLRGGIESLLKSKIDVVDEVVAEEV
jgi:Fe-S cluster biogenesis protein NfuA